MNNDQFKALVSTMPPLYHTLPGHAFDINKSQPVDWLMVQPGFRDWVWNKMRNTDRIECFGHDKKWRGVLRRERKKYPKVACPRCHGTELDFDDYGWTDAPCPACCGPKAVSGAPVESAPSDGADHEV